MRTTYLFQDGLGLPDETGLERRNMRRCNLRSSGSGSNFSTCSSVFRMPVSSSFSDGHEGIHAEADLAAFLFRRAGACR